MAGGRPPSWISASATDAGTRSTRLPSPLRPFPASSDGYLPSLHLHISFFSLSFFFGRIVISVREFWEIVLRIWLDPALEGAFELASISPLSGDSHYLDDLDDLDDLDGFLVNAVIGEVRFTPAIITIRPYAGCRPMPMEMRLLK